MTEKEAAAPDAEMAEPAEDAGEKAAEEEKPAEPEVPVEPEQDAPDDKRPKLKRAVGFNPEDTTLNAVFAAESGLLVTMAEGGFQFLVAGAKGNVGVKKGRYVFEACVLGDGRQQQLQGRSPQVVRLGFATKESSLFLGEGEENVGYDAEGFFMHGKVRKRLSPRVAGEQVLAMVLNLDDKSPQANTVSIFRNGVRVAEPQALPESLKGKTLFPAVCVRGAALRLSFKGAMLRELPFKCRKLGEAAGADCELREPVKPKDGRYEVAVPVALPDEGGYDWVDQFLAANPTHVELSNRALIDWAEKSGLWRKNLNRGCSDRPEPGFGNPLLDDLATLQRLLLSMAPALPRNFVVPDVRGNLLAERRKALAESFPGFKKRAVVLVGEPPASFKEHTHAALLKEKKARAELEAKRKKVEAERRRILEAKRKKMAKPGEEEAEEEAEPEAPAAEEEEEVVVELSEEEKKVAFRKKALPDVAPSDLAKAFTKFSLPGEDEGFDATQYEWSKGPAAATYLKEWISKKKATQRVEDIAPTQAFRESWAAWQKKLVEWKKAQADFKKGVPKPVQKEEAKEGDEEKGEEEKPADVNAEDVDPMRVDDICDLGSGEPLFANFEYEDWALLSLRYELHMLLHGFRKDLDDPERVTFHESHLSFYFQRYFKKALDLRSFSSTSVADLLEMVRDTAVLSEAGMLESQLPEDSGHDSFVKLAEEHRRDRQRRLDAGDESAELKFARPQPARQVSNQWTKPGARPAYAARPSGVLVPGMRQAVPAGPQPPKFAPRPTVAAVSPGVVKTPFVAAPRIPGSAGAASSGAPGAGVKRVYVPGARGPSITPLAKQARKW